MDENLCTYVKIIAQNEIERSIFGFSDIIYDYYWECKAVTTGSKNYCENIDSISGYEYCLGLVSQRGWDKEFLPEL